LTAVLVLVAAIEWTPGLRDAFAPWNRLYAEITGCALQLAGLPVQASDALLVHPSGFRARIVYGCTGFVPGLLVVAWVASLRQPLRIKLTGIACGLTLVTIVNLARIAVVIQIGATDPSHLALAHEVLGHGTVILSTGAFLVGWHWLTVRGDGLAMQAKNRPATAQGSQFRSPATGSALPDTEKPRETHHH